MESFRTHFRQFCLFVIQFLFGAVATGLMIISLSCITYLEDTEQVYVCADSIVPQVLAILAACAGILAFSRISCSKALQVSERNIRRILLVFAGALGIFWVLSTQFLARADQMSCLRGAAYLRSGISDLVVPGGYLARYPHQMGLVLTHYLLGTLYGDYNCLAFQLLNVVAYVLVLGQLSFLGGRMGLSEKAANGVIVLGILFLPLLFYTSFVYGILWGLAFALLAIRCTLVFLETHRISQGALAALFLFLSIVCKSNYQIFGIGLLIYVFLRLLRNGSGKSWYLLPALLAAYFAAGMIPIWIGQTMTGADLSHGTTALSWVAMGLQFNGDQAPGRYNDYVWNSYTEAGFDPQVQKQMALGEIRGQVQRFLSEPRYAVGLFSMKTASQWSEPLFDSIWILQQMQSQITLPAWVSELISAPGYANVSRWANLLHILILFFSMVFAFSHFSRKNADISTVFMLIFLGGFLFHLFWESKGQYTFPYFVLLLPLSVCGCKNLAVRFRNAAANPSSVIKELLPLGAALCVVVLAVIYARFASPDYLQSSLQRFQDYVRTNPTFPRP